MNLSNYSNYFSALGSSSRSNSMYSILSNSIYSKAVGKYAIERQYGKYAASNATSKTFSSQYTNSAKASSQTKKATTFLNNYTTQYNSLKKATSDLESTLNAEDRTTQSTISAVEQYVKSYNSTSNFLDKHSSSATSNLNYLKSSLDVVGSTMPSGIGITQNSDGTLTLDSTALTSALQNNADATTTKLSSLTSLAKAHTTLASKTSNVSLLKEQNLTSLSTATGSNLTYANFASLASNPTQLKNYYFGLASTGSLFDFLA